jgi:hypothetical protein
MRKELIFSTFIGLFLILFALWSCKKDGNNNNQGQLQMQLLKGSGYPMEVIGINPLNEQIPQNTQLSADLNGTEFTFTKRKNYLTAVIPDIAPGRYKLNISHNNKTQSFDFEVLAPVLPSDISQYINNHETYLMNLLGDLKVYNDSLISNNLGDSLAIKSDFRLVQDNIQSSINYLSNALEAEKIAYIKWFEANKSIIDNFYLLHRLDFPTIYVRNCLTDCASKNFDCCNEGCAAKDATTVLGKATKLLWYKTCTLKQQEIRRNSAQYNQSMDLLGEMFAPNPSFGHNAGVGLVSHMLGTFNSNYTQEMDGLNKPEEIIDLYKSQLNFYNRDTAEIYIGLKVGTITPNEQFGVYKSIKDGIDDLIAIYQMLNASFQIPFSNPPSFPTYNFEIISNNGDLGIQNLSTINVSLEYLELVDDKLKVVFSTSSQIDQNFTFDVVYNNGEISHTKTFNATLTTTPPLQWVSQPTYGNTSGGPCLASPPFCECVVLYETTGGGTKTLQIDGGTPISGIPDCCFYMANLCSGFHEIKIYDSRDTLTGSFVIP